MNNGRDREQLKEKENEKETEEVVDHSKIIIVLMLEEYTFQRRGNRRVAGGQRDSSSA